MIRSTMVMVMLLGAATVFGGDLGALKGLATEAGKQAGLPTSETAMDLLTKRLKRVQNEHGPIKFVTGKAAIDPACDPTMQQIADILAEFPGFRVQVDGHTDNVGKAEANRKLSEERANAVVQYLVQKKGIKAKRLTAKGWGDAQPIADNRTEEGRAKNRRVDFTVTRL